MGQEPRDDGTDVTPGAKKGPMQKVAPERDCQGLQRGVRCVAASITGSSGGGRLAGGTVYPCGRR